MSNLEALRNNVPDKIYNRGRRYYYNGNIFSYNLKKLGEERYQINALVVGTYKYRVKVELEILDDNLHFESICSCPYDWANICKHEVAVIYKFLKEDYEELRSDLLMKRNYNKLFKLSRTEDEDSLSSLEYYIKGLLDEKLVNFKFTLKSDGLTDDMLKEIVISIHNSFYYFTNNKMKDWLTRKDHTIIETLNNLETSKSRMSHSFLLAKNEESFDFIQKLIENHPVYFEETGERIEIGEKIEPELVLQGDETEISFTLKESDSKIYQAPYSQLSWMVKDSALYPVNMEVFTSLPERVKIPENKKGEFLFEVLPSLQERYKIEVSEGLKKYELIQEEPEIKLKFDYLEDIIYCYSKVKLSDKFYEGPEILGLDLDQKDYQRSEDDPELWYSKDKGAIKVLIDFLEEYNFYVQPTCFILKDKGDIQEFITDGIIHLPEEWEVETTSDFETIEVKPVELDPVIEFEEGEGIDWFEFKIVYNLRGNTYSREELQRMISYNKQGRPYLHLGNSYYILQENEKEERVNELINLADKKGDGYKSNYYNLLYYRNLLEETGLSLKGNRVYNEMNKDISGEKLIQRVEIPAEVSNILRDYQKKGYYWLRFLHKYRFGGILADDMGLGKTVQTLTLLKSISSKRPALITCPRTLIYNWGEEVKKFFPEIKYLVYYGTPLEREEMRSCFDKYDLIITSYSIISRDYQEINKSKVEFSYCVLDEAQHIKNFKTLRARGVKKIKAERKLALTGTPLENSVEELWSIFDFLMKGYLGNYSQFRRNYLTPIKKENDQNKLEELRKRVSPFILRRKKEEVLSELPEKIINIQPVEMTKLQHDSYRAVLDEVKSNIIQTVKEKGFNHSRINVLAALTKLRQICNHPALVLGKKGQKQSSGKLEVLQEIVEDAIEAGHKLIVFSQFVKMLKLIRHSFGKKGINYEYLDGSTRNRMERVKHFNEDAEVKVFLISLKAGGLGLNLTAADIVIHVDPWWNPMVERQATDRAHRLGQQKRVMVYKMITNGTIEEKMVKLQQKKQKVFESIIENNSNPMEAITWEDIKELLEIG